MYGAWSGAWADAPPHIRLAEALVTRNSRRVYMRLLWQLRPDLVEPVERDDETHRRRCWVLRRRPALDEERAASVGRHVVAARLVGGEIACRGDLHRRAGRERTRGGYRNRRQGPGGVEIEELALIVRPHRLGPAGGGHLHPSA